ncbi:MAG: tRNA dimethylallyltransferase [bacterium]|nr:MAG: tRNA dimethylallyltransferase [bacterium]
MRRNIKLLVIAGSTASGKSELAAKTARILDGEIVSADSVQVYRHFNIGSAKPQRILRDAVPHHLIDIMEPDQPFTMWDFRVAAQKAISEITSRGKLPVLVGGTGLYLKALLENLDGGAASNPHTRALLKSELEAGGLTNLYERLRGIDPVRAQEIHPNDRQRIIRALENAQSPQLSKKADHFTFSQYDAKFFVLGGPRKPLYERIDARVEEMFENGWIDETRAIVDMGYEKKCKPFHCVGYRQIMLYLEGELPKEELVPRVQRETRRYAKRQITWFAKVKGAVWLNSLSAGEDDMNNLADHICGYFK